MTPSKDLNSHQKPRKKSFKKVLNARFVAAYIKVLYFESKKKRYYKSSDALRLVALAFSDMVR